MEKRSLKTILDEIAGLDHITFGNIVNFLKYKSLPLICIITTLPFMQPVPIPGISTIFALIIFLQAMGMLFLNRPILTKRIRNFHISKEKFVHFQKGADKILKYLEKIIHPRFPEWVNHPLNIKFQGILIAVLALILSLPLPIPTSNFVPALGIFLICLGLLEDDFLLILLADLISVIFFVIAHQMTDTIVTYLKKLF